MSEVTTAESADATTISTSVERRIAIVLTATVRPGKSIHKLARSDPDTRLSDYVSAVQSWRKLADRERCALVVVDNSSELPAEYEDALACSLGVNGQLLRFPEVTTEKGKGEATLLDQAIQHVGSVMPPGTLVVKCTGRLRVTNAKKLLNGFAGQSEPMGFMMSSDLSYADSRLFSVTPLDWRRWYAGMAQEVREPAGHFLEHVLAARTLRAVGAGVPLGRLSAVPRFRGHSGSTGQHYGSAAATMRWAAHEAIRSLVLRRSMTL